jgi:hypothetical protein
MLTKLVLILLCALLGIIIGIAVRRYRVKNKVYAEIWKNTQFVVVIVRGNRREFLQNILPTGPKTTKYLAHACRFDPRGYSVENLTIKIKCDIGLTATYKGNIDGNDPIIKRVPVAIYKQRPPQSGRQYVPRWYVLDQYAGINDYFLASDLTGTMTYKEKQTKAKVFQMSEEELRRELQFYGYKVSNA